MGIEWESKIRLKCQNNGQVRHKCTKLMKKPTPATPVRPLCDGGGVGFFSLNKGLIPRVLGDIHGLFVHADTKIYFLAQVRRKKILPYKVSQGSIMA